MKKNSMTDWIFKEVCTPHLRSQLRKSAIRSLLVAFGRAGTIKRVAALRTFKNYNERKEIKSCANAALKARQLADEILKGSIVGYKETKISEDEVKFDPIYQTGVGRISRYTRARKHIKNKKIMLPPKKITKTLMIYGWKCLKHIDNLSQTALRRVISRHDGLRPYRRYLKAKSRRYQH